ncbi:MAG: hypothetical protein IT379_37320 [Deltaproteobacteria bacterium]|nr:hypothetical protein [Deltaproteobacteria bacterium]
MKSVQLVVRVVLRTDIERLREVLVDVYDEPAEVWAEEHVRAVAAEFLMDDPEGVEILRAEVGL